MATSATKLVALENGVRDQRAHVQSKLDAGVDAGDMAADVARLRELTDASRRATAEVAAGPAVAEADGALGASRALGQVASLQKENTKLRYRVQTLLRSLAEEEERQGGSFQFGATPADAAPVLDVGRAWARRTPLRSLLGGADQGVAWIGRSVTVAGWLTNVRAQRKNAFLTVNDGSSVVELQLVLDQAHPSWPVVAQAARGAAICAQGTVIKSLGKGQAVELRPDSVQLLGASDPAAYDLSKPKHSLEHLRTLAHIRARVDPIAATMRIRSALAMATHLFFQERGFLWLHTPVITASDCEGAGEMFQVTTLFNRAADDGDGSGSDGDPQEQPVITDEERAARAAGPFVDGKPNWAAEFFGKPAYLTVSGQLNAEMYACALGKVYTFGPTFRAENSHTQKHLAEFWMIEPEVAFADMHDSMALAEAYVRRCVAHVLEHCADDVLFFEQGNAVWRPGDMGSGARAPGLRRRLQRLADEPFARCSYADAIRALKASGREFQKPVEFGVDPGSDMEKYLTEVHFKQTPVILYDYPKEIKSFYMRENDQLEDGHATVAAFDVLVPGIGEMIGGSQREERVDRLTARMKEKGLDVDDYSAYLDLRRFGTVPHAGFGLGFERLVMLVTGMDNIRDVIPFPRYPRKADF